MYKKKVLFLIFMILIKITVYSQDSLNLVNEFNLDHQALKDFKKATNDKLISLTNNIIKITSKTTKESKKDIIINNTVLLFTKKAKIEVSKISSDGKKKFVKSYPIREYLTRLKKLLYTKCEISYYDLSYLSNFQLGPDGHYYAVATVFQKFVGYQDENVIYYDKTKKQISIRLEWRYDEVFKKYRWMILFGDTQVIETKKH